MRMDPKRPKPLFGGAGLLFCLLSLSALLGGMGCLLTDTKQSVRESVLSPLTEDCVRYAFLWKDAEN